MNIADPEKFKNLTGLGVTAEYNHKKYSLGNLELINQEGANIEIPEAFLCLFKNC